MRGFKARFEADIVTFMRLRKKLSGSFIDLAKRQIRHSS